MSSVRIPVARPFLAREEERAAARAIRSRWVTQGPEVAAFEDEFARAVEAPFACAVSSGTAALHLALLAYGVGPGDEVITASHSFIATANVIRHCGAVPIFVDVEAGTSNMTASAVAEALTKRTRAVLCVHQLGMPCDVLGIVAAAGRVPVIEDAACAIGSEIHARGRWQRIGRPHGAAACFSFHPRKVLTTGDGGMVVTRDRAVADRIKRLRQHSMSIPDLARHNAKRPIRESYPEVGYNYRMTDVQAAIGRVQLGRLDAFVARRRLLARRYLASLAGLPEVSLPQEPSWARSNWQSFCVTLSSGSKARACMTALLRRGIATRGGVMCAHREPAYRELPARFTLPVSEALQDRGVILPLYHEMTLREQDAVVHALRAALRG